MDQKAVAKARKKENKDRRKNEMRHYYDQLDKLALDDARDQLAFPPTLGAGERKKLHTYAHKIGLKSKSNGSGT